MTNKDIKQIIQNGGATIDYKGNIAFVKSGYMASYQDYECKINQSYTKSILERVVEYIKAYAKKGNYVGIWVCNGYAYIDVSKRLSTKKEAMIFAKDNSQLAIFDNRKRIAIEC